MSIVTRFAPSPTGALHLGHAWSAVQAHARAREAGGRFLLRIEDIDGTRSRPEHVAGILADMRWLGLDWDGEVVFQSQRLDRYTDALARLEAMGLVYRCTCTRADIAAAASAPHGVGWVVYPGTCRWRGVDPARPHCWRLDMGKAIERAGPLDWTDEIAGTVVADPAMHGDVVLARKDAPSSYHLAVTVDDAALGVTHIIRGRDLFEATHVHRLLQALLDLPTPVYRHHALLAGPDGERLAKRHGAPSLADLRAGGMGGGLLAMDLKAGRLPLGFGVLNA
ncbi:tRNA glutamyl-Q(34) synthetase GluQRS [uncultured Sphingomonas sp.]|uniref:tRNA glutamyl-Q(34) synthetase GluQRS n=1 Tax=uncultured Sphingomonas sp. TaxID=158754 RepID=UPI0025D88626|nr:tRNA glutamyl-Q(34) synthetase GluQRS [uncultured Sphingomonas sp.]